MAESAVLDSSFRDPSGFVFRRGGQLFRQVNAAYQSNYAEAVRSGLYDELTGGGLLVAHREVDEPPHDPSSAYKVLEPELIPFVSYPYEWCFGQLKDAALLTLDIQLLALRRGMTLKDASAYNVQFRGSRPVFIDTLSFEAYEEGRPWVAYRQFCRHFLAPLALMARVDVRLGRLLRSNLDGIPLDLASRLLPASTVLNLGLMIHIHLHARAQRAFGGGSSRPRAGRVGRTSLLGLLDTLRSAIRRLDWSPGGTEWADYYEATNYSASAGDEKGRLVEAFLEQCTPATVWDLGANTGRYSRLAGGRGIDTIAFDIDPACVERNYREAKRLGDRRVLPLLLDATDPSPPLGWENRERMAIFERGPADLVLALALVHHLAIGGNVPLPRVADFFGRIARRLVIEFVPKSDSQVRRLLAAREDIFPGYDRGSFEDGFSRNFTIDRAEPIAESERTLYLMTNRGPA
jgi:ribosomal protein L11 methylase PrmA